MSSISLQNFSAAAVSDIARKPVSSPAIEPTRFLIPIESIALQAAGASPGNVLITTMFRALAYDVTLSLKIALRRCVWF
jgi:hypothetical protein